MSDRLLETESWMWDLCSPKRQEAAGVPAAFLRCNQSRSAVFVSAENTGSLFRWTSHPIVTFSLCVEHDQNKEGPDLNWIVGGKSCCYCVSFGQKCFFLSECEADRVCVSEMNQWVQQEQLKPFDLSQHQAVFTAEASLQQILSRQIPEGLNSAGWAAAFNRHWLFYLWLL